MNANVYRIQVKLNLKLNNVEFAFLQNFFKDKKRELIREVILLCINVNAIGPKSYILLNT